MKRIGYVVLNKNIGSSYFFKTRKEAAKGRDLIVAAQIKCLAVGKVKLNPKGERQLKKNTIIREVRQ